MGESVQANSTAKLLIGIPTYGMPRCEFTIDSLAALLFHIGRRHPGIQEVWVQRDVRTYRQAARQAIVESAQSLGATHLLMLDDDHSFSGEDFDKLWEAMQRDEAVQLVCGLYMTRGLPPVPCIFRLTEEGTVPIFYYPDNQVVKVDVVGFGFTLFNMQVFSRINPPWFDLGRGYGEDAAFCARMIQAGLGVYVHTGAKIGHLLEQPHVITEADYLQARDTVWRDVTPSKLVPIGVLPFGGNGESLAARRGWRHGASRLWNGLTGKHPSGSSAPSPTGDEAGADSGGSDGAQDLCPAGETSYAAVDA